MSKRSQVWFASILMGLVTIALLWDGATAIEAAFLYAALLASGIVLVRVLVHKWGLR